MKRTLIHEHLKQHGEKLQCVVDVVRFLRQHMNDGLDVMSVSKRDHVTRVFLEVKFGEVDGAK